MVSGSLDEVWWMDRNGDILIVGAGVVGLATALALHRVGVKSNTGIFKQYEGIRLWNTDLGKCMESPRCTWSWPSTKGTSSAATRSADFFNCVRHRYLEDAIIDGKGKQ